MLSGYDIDDDTITIGGILGGAVACTDTSTMSYDDYRHSIWHSTLLPPNMERINNFLNDTSHFTTDGRQIYLSPKWYPPIPRQDFCAIKEVGTGYPNESEENDIDTSDIDAFLAQFKNSSEKGVDAQ